MRYMDSIFSFLVTALFVSLSSSASFAVSGSTLVKAGEELKVVFSSTKTTAGKTLMAQLVNAEGKVVQTISSEVASPAKLRSFLPSKVSASLKEAQGQAAQQAGFSVGRIMYEKLLRFPTESAGFFVALGGVMFFETVYNQAHNPVAYDQLISSQMDPVGQLAFYSFMVANGVAAEPMMMAIKNGKLSPRFGPFVTFMGMGVGSVASNIVHELGHAPNMWKCVRTLLSSGGLDEACDKAGESWIERGGVTGIMNEWAPGFVSLMGSVILSGTIQSSLSGLGKIAIAQGIQRGIITTSLKITADWTAVQVLKVAGIEIATALVPGGLVVKGLRIALFVGQLFLFTGIDELIRAPIAFAYGNAWDVAPDLRDMETTLVSDLIRLKKNAWQPSGRQDLDSHITEFSKLMTKWRQVNLAPILEAQQNWEQKLGQLTMMYKGARVFYSDYLEHLWQKSHGRYKEQYQSGQEVRITDRLFPLNGVKLAPGIDFQNNPNIFFDAPDMIEQKQRETIQSVVKQYRQTSLGLLAGSPLNPEQSKIIHRVVAFLGGQEIKQIVYGIEQLNCLIYFRSDNPPIKCENGPTSGHLRRHAMALREALGDPRPLWKKGEGYVRLFEDAPVNSSLVTNTIHPAHIGQIVTKTLGESMLSAMIFGPDPEKGAHLIDTKSGFPAIFRAPKIVTAQEATILRPPPTSPLFIPSIFDNPITVDSKPQQTTIYQYLRADNIKPSVMAADHETFEKWWARYPEWQYVRTWNNYEELYQKNVADLVEKLWRHDDSLWNRGPISNAVMTSLNQEIRFYLMTLGELLKDVMVLKRGAVPQEGLDVRSLVNITDIQLDKEIPTVFDFLRQNKNLQFSLFMTMQKVNLPSFVQHVDGRNYLWQTDLLNDLQTLENLIRQIKVMEVTKKDGSTKTVTATRVKNADLLRVSDDLKKKLDLVKIVFLGVSDELAQSGQMELPVVFNDFQKRVASACLNGLAAAISEYMNIGLMANAVSYVERHDKNGFTNPRCLKSGPATPKAGGVRFVQEALGCQ